MTKFGTSQPVRRREDIRLLTGTGAYVDDTAPSGALHAVVFRSPVAHGTIEALEVEDARAAPGVRLVLTAADLAEAGRKNEIRFTAVDNADGTKGARPPRPILAEGRVRFVGEPVALVVAETAAQARDAAELILLDTADLPAKTDVAPGGETLHAEAPDNVAYDWQMGDREATEDLIASAAHVVVTTIADNRIICNSLEPRGCYAEVEAGGKLHFCVNGQGVWGTKSDLARWLDRAPETIRVSTPDVGGGFGMKGQEYPEHYLISEAALRLGTPVRWMSERTEAMLSDNAGRDLVCEATLAFDADYRLLTYKMESLSNLGAYCSQFGQPIQSRLFARVFTGTYDVQTVFMRNRGIFTNTTQVDAYRGAGRPEAIFTLERAMDQAARELGVDPFELRRKSFIAPEKFPYKTASGELYDVGDFGRVLDRAAVEADVAGFEARRQASAAEGKLRGLGLCYYIESILGDPEETAKLELTGAGAKLYVGTQSNGQGHETVYTQMVHEDTGIPFDAIEIVQGDSDRIAKGGGTGGSRSVTTQGTAIKSTTAAVIDAFLPFVQDQMASDEAAFDAEEGVFRAPGSNTVLTLLEAAKLAQDQGRDDLLITERTTRLPGRSYPNGAHICEVEIDRVTGNVEVVKYTVVDDFGNLMNPMLVEGQVHGGVAQGIGQALTEHVVYDADGQLLTATFMDYGMPRAYGLPLIAFYTEPVPSTANVLGMKGCGEAGTVGALAAVANAMADAVWDLGIRRIDMPYTPSRVWAALSTADRAVAAE